MGYNVHKSPLDKPLLRFEIVYFAPDEKSSHGGQTQNSYIKICCPPPLLVLSVTPLWHDLFRAGRSAPDDIILPSLKIESAPDEKYPGHASV